MISCPLRRLRERSIHHDRFPPDRVVSKNHLPTWKVTAILLLLSIMERDEGHVPERRDESEAVKWQRKKFQSNLAKCRKRLTR